MSNEDDSGWRLFRRGVWIVGINVFLCGRFFLVVVVVRVFSRTIEFPLGSGFWWFSSKVKDGFWRIAEKVVKIDFSNVRWNKNVVLFECFNRLDTLKPLVSDMGSFIRCTYLR